MRPEVMVKTRTGSKWFDSIVDYERMVRVLAWVLRLDRVFASCLDLSIALGTEGDAWVERLLTPPERLDAYICRRELRARARLATSSD